jgi:hypothetical protein
MFTRRDLLKALPLSLALPAGAQTLLRGVSVRGTRIGPPFDPLLIPGVTAVSYVDIADLGAGLVATWPNRGTLGVDFTAFAGAEPTVATAFDGLPAVTWDAATDWMRCLVDESLLRFLYNTSWTASWSIVAETIPAGALYSWASGGNTPSHAGPACFLGGSSQGGTFSHRHVFFLANGTTTATLCNPQLTTPIAHVFRLDFDPVGTPKGSVYVDGTLIQTYTGAFTPADVAGQNLGLWFGRYYAGPSGYGIGPCRHHLLLTPKVSASVGIQLDNWAKSRFLEPVTV